MASAANPDRVFAIILAAGSGSRFGGGKLTADWRGTTLVKHACQQAATVCGRRTILVTGHDWPAVRNASRPLAGGFVINEKHATGMGSSLAMASRCIRHAAAAVLVMLADQPLVTARHLAALLDSWSGDRREIVASAYSGTLGVPALFGAACFDELCSLANDEGARKILRSSNYNIQQLSFAEAAVDIDTQQDLLNLANSARS